MREIIGCPERSWSYPRTDNRKAISAMDDIIPPEYNPIPDNYFDEVIRRVAERSEELSRPFEPVVSPTYHKIKPPVTEKCCTHCKSIKSVSEFSIKQKNYKGTTAYTSWCKVCLAERKRNHYTLAEARREFLKRKYNLTLEDYEMMLFQQCGVCAACGTCASYCAIGVTFC